MQIIIKDENLKSAQKLAEILNEKTISKAINKLLKNYNINELIEAKKSLEKALINLELIKRTCEEKIYPRT